MMRPKLSFELLPTANTKTLSELITILTPFAPTYFSVACLNDPDLTQKTVQYLIEHSSVAIAPHVKTIGATKETMHQLLQTYAQMGIEQLIVVRGDSSPDHVKGDFPYAVDLVQFIHTQYPTWRLGVAVDPEHFELRHLQDKIAAGAHYALTQFFYNPSAYAHLLAQCQLHNITIPIIPGLLPIDDEQQIKRLAQRCHVSLPKILPLAVQLAQALLEYGAPRLHFYTLNQVEPVQQLLNHLGFSNEN